MKDTTKRKRKAQTSGTSRKSKRNERFPLLEQTNADFGAVTQTRLPVTLRLPWAPSANVIWRNLRSGAVYLSPQYRTFLNDAYYAYLAQGKPRVDNGELLQVTLRLFPPHRRAYDIDNRIKPTLDALTKIGFWKDDRYVRKITVVANEPVDGGAIVLDVDAFQSDAEKHTSQALLTWHGLKPLTKGKGTNGKQK